MNAKNKKTRKKQNKKYYTSLFSTFSHFNFSKMYFKKVQRIGDLITTDLRKIVGPESSNALDAVHVVNTWRQMLGTTMVRYSEGEIFQDGALRVRIKSAVLRNDLFMQRTNLIEKLNQQLGNKIVFTITFY